MTDIVAPLADVEYRGDALSGLYYCQPDRGGRDEYGVRFDDEATADTSLTIRKLARMTRTAMRESD